MSESLLDRMEGLLTEEMWTRAALSNYSVPQFEGLEALLAEAYQYKQTEEVKQLCDERLAENKNSILAMYLSGVIAWEDQQLEDADLVTLINLFSDSSKWIIVEYICKKMLNTGESKLALKALAKVYDKQGQKVDYYDVLERLARLDYEDADLAMQLAHYYEEQEMNDEALSYYKKAIYRYINRKQFAGVQEVWAKLLSEGGDSDELFSGLLLKTEKTMGVERAIELQKSLYPLYKARGQWDQAIVLLKKMLFINPKDVASRRELVECYRQKHKDNSRLEECITITNLAQNWRNVQEAYESFEKHISLDKGRYVFHRTWGIGRIKKMNEEMVSIDFSKKRGHEMSLEMATTSLTSLFDQHIWVLKATMSRDDLRDKIKKDIPWALETMALSFPGESDMKKVKSELSSSDAPKGTTILTPSEWSSWSTEARKVLKNNPAFGNNASKGDIFILRSSPVSFEEKVSNRFKTEENFFKKLDIIHEFLENSEEQSDYFTDMFNYFFSYLKAGIVNEMVVTSYLFVQKMIKDKVVNVSLPYSFSDLYNDITDVELLFVKIENKNYASDFLSQARRYVAEWSMLFVNLLPQFPSDYMVDELRKEMKEEELKEAFGLIVDRYRNYPEAFFWLTSHFPSMQGSEYGITEDKIIINLIHLADVSYRNIVLKKDLPLNKRINRMAMTKLFKEGRLSDFITVSSEKSVARIYALLNNIKDLDSALLHSTAVLIKKIYPDISLELVHTVKPEKESMLIKTTRGSTILVLESSYKQKALELKNIVEVEIPKNSAEIGEAIKKGDLKENAEYIFGKERQEYLQKEVGRLQKELDSARIFETDKIDPLTVSFGTVVTLYNGEISEAYTILGPWESNPDKNILSYLAPFSSELLGKKVGDKLKFSINETNYKFSIKKIDIVVL